MKIKHKNLRSLKKTNQAQPYPPRDTTAAHRGQTQLVLSKAPSRRCSLQCTTVFICYCEVAATKTCSYSLQDKGERDFLTNTAVFSTSVPLCLQHSLSAITHRRAQSFPVALAWNNTSGRAFFMDETVQWHCSAQLQYHLQVTTLYELLWREFIPVHSKECRPDRFPFGDPLTWTKLPHDVPQLNILIRCNGFQAWMFPSHPESNS